MEVSKIAAALKAINDAGTKLLSDCMAASDGKKTFDAEPVRNACADLFTALAPKDEIVRQGEIATGADNRKASDSRLAYDNYGRRVPARRMVSTTHTIGAIFGGSKHDDGHERVASDASIGSIFNGDHD